MEKSIQLSNGVALPMMGLGTWELYDEICFQAVIEALQIGYRHIDTAYYYKNHESIRRAIAPFSREAIFLTSKLANDQIKHSCSYETVEKALDTILEQLGVDYLDAFLLHSPDRSKPYVEVIHHMQKLQKKGKAKSIGVCNCTTRHLQDILDGGCDIQINQVEFHPFLYQKELLAFCNKHNIQLMSFRSLGKGKLLNDPQIEKIAKKHRKSPSQILLRWCIEKQVPVIPKSSNPKRLKENFSIWDFKLDDSDMDLLDSLDQGKRFCDSDWTDFNYL